MLYKNPCSCRAYKAAEIEMAHKAIVVLVVLVRQFMLGIGFLVVTFWRREFFGNVLNRVHRLERY